MPAPARQGHLQDIAFLRTSLSVASLLAAGAAGVQVGTLPAGARVLRSSIFIETVFNAGTTNALDVGTVADPDQFLPTATVAATATGLKTLAPPALQGVISADTAVLAIYAPTGTTATTGLATVIIEYAPNN